MAEDEEEMSLGIPDEEIDEIYAEIIAHEKAEKENWEKIKEDLKDLIHPKYFDFIENHDSYRHEGIVEIVETDEKQSGYGQNQRNCRIKDSGMSGLYMYTTMEVEYFYGYEGEYEGEMVEYWVNQWSIGTEGDSFAGYLLFPLSDGRYWKVGYSC